MITCVDCERGIWSEYAVPLEHINSDGRTHKSRAYIHIGCLVERINRNLDKKGLV